MPRRTTEHGANAINEQSRIRRLSFLVPLSLIFVGFSTALACILHNPDAKELVSHVSTSAGHSMPGLVRRVTSPKQISCTIKAPAHFGLRLIYYLFLNPLIAFAVQILLAILSAILVLSQKFAVPDDPEQFCGLEDEGENIWGFGQTLSIFMLMLPVISAGHVYLEGRQNISEGLTRFND